MRKLKTWEWFLLVIFLAFIFLFRFRYELSLDYNYIVRINRITGAAKIYKYDLSSGKYIHYKKEDKPPFGINLNDLFKEKAREREAED